MINSKKIGILGSGVVSQSLAVGFIKYGFEVMLGTRDVNKLAEWNIQNGSKANIGSFAETAQFGDILILATKGDIIVDLLKSLDKESLKNKTILDATNPIENVAPENGVLKFFTNYNESLMEKLQNEIPDGNFVKCFNSIGAHFMVNPNFAEGKPSMFICGNSDEAKAETKEILDIFGWETEDMGLATSARAIEPLCILWCIPGFRSNSWAHAFKMIKA